MSFSPLPLFPEHFCLCMFVSLVDSQNKAGEVRTITESRRPPLEVSSRGFFPSPQRGGARHPVALENEGS